MKVYIVRYLNEIKGVFRSEKSARKFIGNCVAKDKWLLYCNEFELKE